MRFQGLHWCPSFKAYRIMLAFAGINLIDDLFELMQSQCFIESDREFSNLYLFFHAIADIFVVLKRCDTSGSWRSTSLLNNIVDGCLQYIVFAQPG